MKHPSLSVDAADSLSLARAAGLMVALAIVGGCSSSPRGHAGPDNEPWAAFAPAPWPAATPERTAEGMPGPAYWQQRADYVIDATLDDAGMIGTATTITYTNNSPHELRELWLNLEQNLFQPDSRGSRVNEPGGRFSNIRDFTGGYQGLSVEVNGRAVEVRVHDTLGRVALPAPLPAGGGTVTLRVLTRFQLPEYGADRCGIFQSQAGKVFQVAQWFPSVCKYDDVNGWNALPYLGQGEFYTDFGDYTVNITVPRAHLVTCSGELLNPGQVLTAEQAARLERAKGSAQTVVIRSMEEIGDPASRPAGDGPLTWRFRAQNVRTVAWASSAAFAWDAAMARGDGIGPGGSGTLCHSFYPPEAFPLWSPQGERGGATQMLRTSIEHYSAKWFPYPYPSASNVNGVVGGMEYPQIIFCEERKDEEGLFGVTTHEIGHNWFPMIVNTNEKLHAWMDEGFNTFINIYAGRERYGQPVESRAGRESPAVFASRFPEPLPQPIDLPADTIQPRLLGLLQYGKTAVGMALLREDILGPERFDAAFREYIRRWAFKSPRPVDFYRAMENGAGEELGWFWKGWFESRGVLDQAVTGFGGGTGELAGETIVTLENRGELVMPVALRLTFADGSSRDVTVPAQTWALGTVRQVAVRTGDRSVTRVEIDPDARYPDVNRRNNTATH
ncbi:MAG: peptidase [Isosphaera sp.]|nr:peptidase [Isosphaera sp.]